MPGQQVWPGAVLGKLRGGYPSFTSQGNCKVTMKDHSKFRDTASKWQCWSQNLGLQADEPVFYKPYPEQLLRPAQLCKYPRETHPWYLSNWDKIIPSSPAPSSSFFLFFLSLSLSFAPSFPLFFFLFLSFFLFLVALLAGIPALCEWALSERGVLLGIKCPFNKSQCLMYCFY